MKLIEKMDRHKNRCSLFKLFQERVGISAKKKDFEALRHSPLARSEDPKTFF